MRTLTDAQTRIYGLQSKSVAVRVWATDATATEVDLSDYLGVDWIRSVEWGESVDDPGTDATVELARADYGNSLAPFRTLSRPNSAGALLDVGRAIRIETAVFPFGTEPATGDWVEVFRGVVQTVNSGSDPIRIVARGLEDALQRTFIETPAQYSNTTSGAALEDVLQEILNDNLASPPTLQVPASPSWQILAFQSEVHSVWDELDKLVSQIGWCIRYLYDDGATEWQLTLYDPGRGSSTSAWTFAPSQWYDFSTLSTDLAQIRNAVSVTYGDVDNLDASGQPTPATYTAEDGTSIAAYGRTWMGLTLDASSNIDTAAEAQQLAEAVVSDLAWPLAGAEVETAFVHFLQLGDTITLGADRIRLDTDYTAAVVGYRSTIATGKARTRLQLRLAGPVSSVSGWLSRSAQRGVAALQQIAGPISPNDYAPIIEQTVGGVKFSPAGHEIVRKGGYQIEVHCGPTGFTPDYNHGSATFLGRAKASALAIQADMSRLPIGEPLEFAVVYLNDRGVRSAPYTISSSALRPGLGFFSNLVRFAGSFAGSTFSFQSRGTAYPPDGWNMSIGAWGSGAELVESGSFGPQTGKYSMMLSTSNEIEVLSETFPVAVRRKYTSQIALKADTLDTISVSVEWLDSSESVLSTDTIMYGSVGIVNTWETRKRTHSPPGSARYARCRINKPATDMKVTLDRLLFEEDPEREDAPQRILLDDDFAGADGDTIGSLGWGLYVGVEDPDPGPASVAKQAASDWRRVGIVVLSAADVTSYPQITYSLALGTYDAPTFYGVPPAGTEMFWVVSMESATTNVTAWCGVWSDATQAVGPDSAPAAEPVQVGIGFVARAGAWYGVVRVNSGGTYVNHEVDLATDADTAWRRLGWRIVNESDVQFFVGDVAVGAVQSTDSLDGGLSPIFGLIATGTTDTPGIRVDRVTLSTLLDRDAA